MTTENAEFKTAAEEMKHLARRLTDRINDEAWATHAKTGIVPNRIETATIVCTPVGDYRVVGELIASTAKNKGG